MEWRVDPNAVVMRMQEACGRPSLVFAAVLDVLRANLVPVLDALGLIPAQRRGAAYPKAFLLAGEELGRPDDAHFWPAIIVGGAVQEDEFAMGWQDTVQVTVTVAWPGPVISRREFLDALEIATVCSGIFRLPQFAGAVRDTQSGAVLWWQMMPAGYSIVPTDWQYYSGWMAHLIARQSPASSLW
jgi:hypothetical protein